LDAPARTFARRQGPDKAALDRGMNLAPVDFEYADAELHWGPSDALDGHLLRPRLATAGSSASTRSLPMLASTPA
jgi:hypothetical protein